MKPLIAAAAFAASLSFADAAQASCGPKSRQALQEMVRAKVTMATAVGHLSSPADRTTVNRTVMTPLSSAIRGLQRLCNDTRPAAPTPHPRPGAPRPGAGTRPAPTPKN